MTTRTDDYDEIVRVVKLYPGVVRMWSTAVLVQGKG
jgi:hypothetical protein